MNFLRKIFGITKTPPEQEHNQHGPLVDWEGRIRDLEAEFGTDAENGFTTPILGKNSLENLKGYT